MNTTTPTITAEDLLARYPDGKFELRPSLVPVEWFTVWVEGIPRGYIRHFERARLLRLIKAKNFREAQP